MTEDLRQLIATFKLGNSDQVAERPLQQASDAPAVSPKTGYGDGSTHHLSSIRSTPWG